MNEIQRLEVWKSRADIPEAFVIEAVGMKSDALELGPAFKFREGMPFDGDPRKVKLSRRFNPASCSRPASVAFAKYASSRKLSCSNCSSSRSRARLWSPSAGLPGSPVARPSMLRDLRFFSFKRGGNHESSIFVATIFTDSKLGMCPRCSMKAAS